MDGYDNRRSPTPPNVHPIPFTLSAGTSMRAEPSSSPRWAAIDTTATRAPVEDESPSRVHHDPTPPPDPYRGRKGRKVSSSHSVPSETVYSALPTPNIEVPFEIQDPWTRRPSTSPLILPLGNLPSMPAFIPVAPAQAPAPQPSLLFPAGDPSILQQPYATPAPMTQQPAQDGFPMYPYVSSFHNPHPTPSTEASIATTLPTSFSSTQPTSGSIPIPNTFVPMQNAYFVAPEPQVFGRDMVSELVQFVVEAIPRETYMLLLLRLPRFYFARVKKVFDDAELSKPDIVRMYTSTAQQWRDKGKKNRFNLANVPVPTWDNVDEGHPNITPALAAFKDSWENFIDSLMREWSTLNIVSALLLSAILTLLTIDGVADDPLSRTASIISLVCGLMSILYACMYIVRFGPMRKMHKAASWAEEAKLGASLLWNVWALLAMPAVWLAWSLISFIVAVMSYVWRTNAESSPSSRATSDRAALGIRIAISCVLGIGCLYFIAMMKTFRRYGEVMDKEWKRKLVFQANKAWLEQRAGVTPRNYPFYFNTGIQPQPQSRPSYQYGEALFGHPVDFAPTRRRQPSSKAPYGFTTGAQPAPSIPFPRHRRRPEPSRQPSLRSPARPRRRSSSDLSVRLQYPPALIPINTSPPAETIVIPGADELETSPEHRPLSIITERTEQSPGTVLSEIGRQGIVQGPPPWERFPAFSVIVFDAQNAPWTPLPLVLEDRGVSLALWEQLMQQLQRAWEHALAPGANRMTSRAEAVFETLIRRNTDLGRYRVRAVLCEELSDEGWTQYAVYIHDSDDGYFAAFRSLPMGVEKVVVLWKAPPWDKEFRRQWTIQARKNTASSGGTGLWTSGTGITESPEQETRSLHHSRPGSVTQEPASNVRTGGGVMAVDVTLVRDTTSGATSIADEANAGGLTAASVREPPTPDED